MSAGQNQRDDGSIRRVRVEAARREEAQDWLLPSLLLAGLALATMANTFVGLIPG